MECLISWHTNSTMPQKVGHGSGRFWSSCVGPWTVWDTLDDTECYTKYNCKVVYI